MMMIKQIVEIAKSATFVCSICQENLKNPVLLPCNHSFCEVCLKSYMNSSPVKNKKVYNCPNCSKTVTKRSSYPAPDIEGALFKDLITSLEIETGIDLTDIYAKDILPVKYDKQRYIQKQNENINPEERSKTNIQKVEVFNINTKESNNLSTDDKILSNKVKSNTKVVKRKRNLRSENDSTPKKKKICTDTKKNESKDVIVINDSPAINKKISSNTEKSLTSSDVEVPNENLKNKQITKFKWGSNSSTSLSLASFHVKNSKNLKTYNRKSTSKHNLTTLGSEDQINSVLKVEKWLGELPPDVLKRSKSLTPNKKSKIILYKNKSLNEIISSKSTELARNLESEVINDLLQIAAPKTNSKDNWTRVKKEFRTSKFKKLDLSSVKLPVNRVSTRNKKASKQSNITNDIINDNKFKMTPRVVLESFEGFKLEEQVNTELNKIKFLSTSENLTNSLLKNSKSVVSLIDQLTTQILNKNVHFSSFFVHKECVNILKKLRDSFGLKEVEITNEPKLFKKEIGTNTENNYVCSKCNNTPNLNPLIDLTQKINPITNTLQCTQRKNQESNESTFKRQMSGDIFIETENDNYDTVNEKKDSSSEKLIFYTPNNESNTSKFMQDIIYDMDDMEFTQTITRKEDTAPGVELKDKKETNIDNSSNILSNDDDDIIESTPKSNKSTSRFQSIKDNISQVTTKVFSQQDVLQSQRLRKKGSETEMSEHPSVILGTEYTQKPLKQLKRKKQKLSVNNDENKLDVTLIEPIETQVVNSIPVLMELPPPTEFMDAEEEDDENISKQNNLNNFSTLPEATILKNMKTPKANINIQELKNGPILMQMSQNVPIISSESVIEQTPLSCYPPKSRVNLSNTKAFKQVSRQVSTSDSESDGNLLEIVKDNTPKRSYNGPSTSKQLSILSYVNSNQDKHGNSSQVSTKSNNYNNSLFTSNRMNPPSLPVNMSISQKKNDDIMNESYRSQFETPSTQTFTRPMASSTPARSVFKSKSSLHRLKPYTKIEIFWTRLSVSQINLLMDFCKQFRVKYTTENVDTTTHLITRVDENNFVEDYTLKYVCAVARGIWVLSFKWIEDCLDKSKILPEDLYEVLDTTGNPGPKMSRLREKPSILLEKFAVCIVSSPATFPKDKLMKCILQNGGKIYQTVEELASACQEGKIRLIITDTPETQDIHTFQDYYERYGILTISTEWVFNTIAIFKVESLVSYLVCTVTDVPEEYPQELLMESEIMSESTLEREK